MGTRTTTMAAAAYSIVSGRPSRPISMTCKGVTTMPPALAPPSATVMASPRRLVNQAPMMEVIAAELVAAQPSDIRM